MDTQLGRSRASDRDRRRGSHGGVAPARSRPMRVPRRQRGLLSRRLQGVIDAGAARLGLHAEPARMPAGVAGLIDHTLLKPDATRAGVEQLCREAAEFKFATVCVNPSWVASARRSCGRRPSASARSSDFRWARRRPTSRTTRRGA